MATASTSPPQRPAALVRLRAFGPRLLVSVMLAIAFIWVLNRGGLPIVPERTHLQRVAWWGPVGYVVFYSSAVLLRTYRWVYLLRPVTAAIKGARVLAVGLVGFAAIFFAPMRMGELVRPWLIAQDGEVTFMQAAGTIAAERIIDGLTVTLVLVLGLQLATPLSPLPDHVGKLSLPVNAVPATAYVTCAVFAGALVLLILFYRWRALARRAVRAVVGLGSVRLAEWLTLRVERLSDGLRFLHSRHGVSFVRDTLAYWTCMVMATWVLLLACGIDAHPAQGAVVLGVMGLGSLIPSGPGFFGTYQLASYCGIAMFFDEATVLQAGAAFTFLSYSLQLTITALFGAFGVFLMGKTRPEQREAA